MIEEVTGIILYSTLYKESSEILQVLTKEHQLIGVLSRGSKKIKNKLFNKTRKYNYVKIYLLYKENGLSIANDIDILDDYNYFHKDITLITYLSYLCNLTYSVAKQDNNPDILKLLLNTLKKIEDGLNPLVLTNILEIKYLKYLGINLYLDGCNICKNTKDIVTLSVLRGGLVCKNCYQNEYIVNKRTIHLIRYYQNIDINSIKSINISKIVINEINLFISEYYETYTGIYVKNKEFLNKLVNE